MKYNKIHLLNLYESIAIDENTIKPKDNFTLVLDSLGVDTIEVLKEIRELEILSAKNISLRKQFKKSKKKELIREIKEVQLKQEIDHKKLETKLLSISKTENLKDLDNPLFLRCLKNRDEIKMIHNLHSSNFNKCLSLLDNEAKLKYDKVLKEHNLSLDVVLKFNKSIKNQNKDNYFKICDYIEKRFKSLKLMEFDNDKFEEYLLSCLRRRKFEDVHPTFDLYHREILFPHLYLCKVLLSKALHQK